MAPAEDNVVVPHKKLEKLLSMKGGKGEASYVNNSQAQVLRSPNFYLLVLCWYPDMVVCGQPGLVKLQICTLDLVLLESKLAFISSSDVDRSSI